VGVSAPSKKAKPFEARVCTAVNIQVQETHGMATFLIAHGAWSAGWVWKKMRPLMQALGHEMFVPTQTGLGERRHLANRDIGLNTHVADLREVIHFEDLRDFILVGHSYGGMVATALADQMADLVSELVYLDAFVPRDGQSLLGLTSEENQARVKKAVSEQGEGWRVPPNPPPPDTGPEDRAWVTPRRVPQPLKCFQEPVQLTGAVDRLHRTYIYATLPAPGDGFRQFIERAQTEPGWTYLEIASSHNPHVTIPETLASMLDDIAKRVDARKRSEA